MLNRDAMDEENRSPDKKIVLRTSAVYMDTKVATHKGNLGYVGNVAKKFVILTEEDINVIHEKHRLSKNHHQTEYGKERETKEA